LGLQTSFKFKEKLRIIENIWLHATKEMDPREQFEMMSLK
jgi:hypothetical protein